MSRHARRHDDRGRVDACATCTWCSARVCRSDPSDLPVLRRDAPSMTATRPALPGLTAIDADGDPARAGPDRPSRAAACCRGSAATTTTTTGDRGRRRGARPAAGRGPPRDAPARARGPGREPPGRGRRRSSPSGRRGAHAAPLADASRWPTTRRPPSRAADGARARPTGRPPDLTADHGSPISAEPIAPDRARVRRAAILAAVPDRLPPPGPSFLREHEVRIGDRVLRVGMARPSDAPDGWWLALLWVADDDGVVSLPRPRARRRPASRSAPRPPRAVAGRRAVAA